jgi:hypothetical protein
MPQVEVLTDDLKAIALGEIRSRRGCEGVKDIFIQRIVFERARSNWSLTLADLGSADRNTAQLSAIAVQRDLQRKYQVLWEKDASSRLPSKHGDPGYPD